MCGIVYKKSLNGTPVNQAVKQLFKNQRDRGIDGFGFYIPKLDRLAHNTREHRILSLLGKPEFEADEILFHHRYPTSTSNVQNACHPFSTRSNAKLFDNNYVLVHNGVVTNPDTLKTEHEKLGIKYVSEQSDGRFNDSEALLYDLALYLDGKQDELKATGSIAFIVLMNGKRLFFGRNYGSPLKYNLTSRGLSVKSEGAGEDVEANKLYEFVKGSFIVKDLDIPSGYTYTGSYTGSYTNAEYDTYIDQNGQLRYFDDDEVTGMVTTTTAYDLLEDFGDFDQAIEFAYEMANDKQAELKALEDRVIYGAKNNGYGIYKQFDDLSDEVDQWWSILSNLYKMQHADNFTQAISPPQVGGKNA